MDAVDVSCPVCKQPVGRTCSLNMPDELNAQVDGFHMSRLVKAEEFSKPEPWCSNAIAGLGKCPGYCVRELACND